MDRVFAAGLTYIHGPWNASKRLLYLGPRALDTLDSVRSRSPTLLNFGARYAANKHMTLDLRITPNCLVANRARASARQFIELAKCMRDAGRAEAVGVDAGIDHAVVAAKVIGQQRFRPSALTASHITCEEGLGVLRAAAQTELVNHARDGEVPDARVGPDVGSMRLAGARVEQLDGRLVCMQYAAARMRALCTS